MLTVGVFGDKYDASTGFATVLRNLSNELTRYFRVIYFGRYGLDDGRFNDYTYVPMGQTFEYVPTIGGIWERDLIRDIVDTYPEIDIIFTEDDWYSALDMITGAENADRPFHFHTPIDSLPINPSAFNEVFSRCDKIYIPNSSAKIFDGKKRLEFSYTKKIRERCGDYLRSVELNHGVDTKMFRKKKVERSDKFTFMWNGRAEQRKCPSAIVKAWMKIHDKMDAELIMRSDFNAPLGRMLWEYLDRKDIPVILDQMEDVPHHEICDVINKGDVNVVTAQAGGFEMGITENAACENISLVTDTCFMNEVVEHGKSGFRIPVKNYTHPNHGYNILGRNRLWGVIDEDSLADKMYWCYVNQAKVKMMGRWARRHVRLKYNWRDIGYQLKTELTS